MKLVSIWIPTVGKKFSYVYQESEIDIVSFLLHLVSSYYMPLLDETSDYLLNIYFLVADCVF